MYFHPGVSEQIYLVDNLTCLNIDLSSADLFVYIDWFELVHLCWLDYTSLVHYFDDIGLFMLVWIEMVYFYYFVWIGPFLFFWLRWFIYGTMVWWDSLTLLIWWYWSVYDGLITLFCFYCFYCTDWIELVCFHLLQSAGLIALVCS